MCRHHHIKLWDIKETGGNITFSIAVKDFKNLGKIAKKANIVPHIIEKRGSPFVIFQGKKHWTFFVAALFFLILLYVYSGFIWNIEVSGQREYTKEELLEAIRNIRVYPGMQKSKLDCDNIETYLRKKYERLSWVSAEEVGSRLIIKVKEGTKTLQSAKEETPAHLVADCDGVVSELVAAKGTPVIQKGQAVKKGDILIQGVVEIKDDAGTVIEKEPVRAKGTVKIETMADYEKKFPLTYQKKIYTGKEQTKYILQIGKKRITIKNPLKQFDKSAKYDIINEVCYNNSRHLFGVDTTLYRQTCRIYMEKTCTYQEKQIKAMAASDFSNLLKQYKDQECTILNKQALLWKRKKDWLMKASIHMLIPQKTTKEVKQEEWSVEHGTEYENSNGA